MTPKKNKKGIAAAGHEKTAEAAMEILDAGGNAYDAIIAAHLSATVAEPILCSLGGGGFLVGHTSSRENVAYDFFVQTPSSKKIAEPDFYPVTVNFGGGKTQEFHIGTASIAVPGNIRGIFRIHQDLGSLPMKRIMEPAIRLAREGCTLTKLQSYLFDIVGPCYRATTESLALFESPSKKGELVGEGDVLRMPEYADTLEALAAEGDRLFYEGDIAKAIHTHSKAHGGYITKSDLAKYEVAVRKPLEIDYKGSRFITNPPPSSGGILIGFALKLLESLKRDGGHARSAGTLAELAEVMAATNQARKEDLNTKLFEADIAEKFLDAELLDLYRNEVQGKINRLGSTTHISVIDRDDNIASMTITNGEGSGFVVPGTGIMMNNMLGEEDLNPLGFGNWPAGTRISSMMAPSVLLGSDGKHYALGSGGSNRIRTAILQVLLRLLDFQQDPVAAVEAPRIHFERGELHIEGGYDKKEIELLRKDFPKIIPWGDRNLFFGGVHIAGIDTSTGEFFGAGDPRRGGVVVR